jgi:AraC-like DNA-binding protein
MVEFSTAGIAAGERLAFWRDAVLRRMEPIRTPASDRPFQGRLRRMIGVGVEFVEHASDAIVAERTRSRCAADAIDDVSIELMLDCTSATLNQNGERKLRAGDICIVDYASPVQVARGRHRAAALMLPRGQVREALGGDIPALGGRRLPLAGIGAVLQSHMRLTLDEGSRLRPAERTVAITAAAEMALAALQTERRGAADVEQFESGFYQAACQLMERDCFDPTLTPGSIAASLGCSRASLYRAFLRRQESVAAMIWEARLAGAHRMLTSASHVGLLISEIAFRNGFLDQPTFNRMFKRRYGLTPRDARTSLAGATGTDRRQQGFAGRRATDAAARVCPLGNTDPAMAT